MKKFTNAARAAQAVYECGGEIYHLEFLRLEKGDEAAIDHLVGHYKQVEGLSAADAHIRAGHFIKDIDALKHGNFGFKAERERIAETERKRFGRPSHNHGFAGA